MASKNRTMAAKNAKLKKWRVETIKADNAKDMCLWGSDGINRPVYYEKYLSARSILALNAEMASDYITDILDGDNPLDVSVLTWAVNEFITNNHKLGRIVK